jgi:hypothetical protein
MSIIFGIFGLIFGAIALCIIPNAIYALFAHHRDDGQNFNIFLDYTDAIFAAFISIGWLVLLPIIVNSFGDLSLVKILLTLTFIVVLVVLTGFSIKITLAHNSSAKNFWSALLAKHTIAIIFIPIWLVIRDYGISANRNWNMAATNMGSFWCCRTKGFSSLDAWFAGSSDAQPYEGVSPSRIINARHNWRCDACGIVRQGKDMVSPGGKCPSRHMGQHSWRNIGPVR